jgi:hypothetical protein
MAEAEKVPQLVNNSKSEDLKKPTDTDRDL